MFLTRTIFDTDPTEFSKSKASLASEMQSKFLPLYEQDQQHASDGTYGIGGIKNPNITDPKIVERLWHNIDIAKSWTNLCKDNFFNGSGLTFVTTIQEVTWDDTYDNYTVIPTVLETIRSDS